MKKLTYKESHNKKRIRNMVVDKGTKVIGLGGPDIADYVSFFGKKGYSSITVWENDGEMLAKQMPQINRMRKKISYNFGDIINAPILPNTLYDLDFCRTITSLKDYVKKFQSNFILTVSEFRKPKFWSINQFLKIRGESVISLVSNNDDERTLITDKQTYAIYYYYDRSPMVVIKTVNK